MPSIRSVIAQIIANARQASSVWAEFNSINGWKELRLSESDDGRITEKNHDHMTNHARTTQKIPHKSRSAYYSYYTRAEFIILVNIVG